MPPFPPSVDRSGAGSLPALLRRAPPAEIRPSSVFRDTSGRSHRYSYPFRRSGSASELARATFRRPSGVAASRLAAWDEGEHRLSVGAASMRIRQQVNGARNFLV